MGSAAFDSHVVHDIAIGALGEGGHHHGEHGLLGNDYARGSKTGGSGYRPIGDADDRDARSSGDPRDSGSDGRSGREGRDGAHGGDGGEGVNSTEDEDNGPMAKLRKLKDRVFGRSKKDWRLR